jgi:hypothetical protein
MPLPSVASAAAETAADRLSNRVPIMIRVEDRRRDDARALALRQCFAAVFGAAGDTLTERTVFCPDDSW